MKNETKDSDLFDHFLRLLDLYLNGIIHKELMESSFSEEEWDELYEWIIALIDLMREYDGSIEAMIVKYEAKARDDQKWKENLHRALHLKLLLDQDPARLARFEEMVSYLENEWNKKVTPVY